MEVILLQDVKSLGKKGDIVKVNDGYAKNFIFPKKLGVEASSKNRQELENQKAAEAERQRQLLEDAKAFGAELEKLSVVVKIKVGEGGRTFGSISTKEISEAIKKQFGKDVDKKKLVLNEAIKNVGTYNVPVKLHPQVTVELKVKVEGE